MDYFYSNNTNLCPPYISLYIGNLTSSYTDKSNEPTMVSASVIMFVLAGLFFNLNLFSGVSDVSATLDPKVRLFMTSMLSLFLPVMSYLFSEAKNAEKSMTSSTTRTGLPDLPIRAGLILTWMLLVELLRKKVDEIRMRGYSSTIQRAGRVVWMGSLVFFTIKDSGRKAVFSILWILCAIKVLQRIAFTEVGKRSYAHGRNGLVLTSYMAARRRSCLGGPADVDQAAATQSGGNELVLKRCSYIVMGEEKLVKEATADGYELNEITPEDSIVTVGKVWELAEGGQDPLFSSHDDKDQRLKRLCLSFALFKLLRRRFEHLPAMTEEEARDCRDLIFKGLYGNGQGKAAEAVFKVMHDEVTFLCEYYHSVVPVVLASPFFLLANYLLLPIAVFALCFMAVVLCGNGDMGYALNSLHADNYLLQSGVIKIAICLLSRAPQSPSAFFSILDLSITILLFIIFFYEEIWEFLVFLLSNWFMVSMLCNYTAKRHWRESLIFSVALRRLVWLRSKMSHAKLTLKQVSLLNLRWPPSLPLFDTTLSLPVSTVLVPNSVKRSVMECLVDRHGAPLTSGSYVLEKHDDLSRRLSWACARGSVAEVILTWHVATSILEIKCPLNKERTAALELSRYCAYLVAFHPELLPDNKEKAERVLEDMKAELKGMLGCLPYFFLSSQRARVERIIQQCATETTAPAAAGSREEEEEEIPVETACQKNQNKVVMNGAKLAKSLMEAAATTTNGPQAVWKILAEVWTELVVYVASSSDEKSVKAHEEVVAEGGEFITVLWALTMHTGMSRCRPPANTSRTTRSEASGDLSV